jgi:hypothetical protein
MQNRTLNPASARMMSLGVGILTTPRHADRRGFTAESAEGAKKDNYY